MCSLEQIGCGVALRVQGSSGMMCHSSDRVRRSLYRVGNSSGRGAPKSRQGAALLTEGAAKLI